MFSALALGHGELNEKINLFVSIAPITNLGLATAGFMDFGNNWYEPVKNAFKTLSIQQIEGPGW